MILTSETLDAYEPLQFVVEVSNTNPRQARCFEPIAAFNVGGAASSYAAKCREANPHNLYRIRVREDHDWCAYEGTS